MIAQASPNSFYSAPSSPSAIQGSPHSNVIQNNQNKESKDEVTENKESAPQKDPEPSPTVDRTQKQRSASPNFGIGSSTSIEKDLPQIPFTSPLAKSYNTIDSETGNLSFSFVLPLPPKSNSDGHIDESRIKFGDILDGSSAKKDEKHPDDIDEENECDDSVSDPGADEDDEDDDRLDTHIDRSQPLPESVLRSENKFERSTLELETKTEAYARVVLDDGHFVEKIYRSEKTISADDEHLEASDKELLSFHNDLDDTEKLVAERQFSMESSLKSPDPKSFLNSPLSDAESIKEDCEIPPSTQYTYYWSVATQKGYKYANTFLREQKLDIHAHMEDQHFPAVDQSPNFQHVITGEPFQVYMLADGHGGHKCAQYAVSMIPSRLVDLINSKDWNPASPSDRQVLRSAIQEIFLEADQIYCDSKLEEFRKWLRQMSEMNLSPYSAAAKAYKPADDGCTLVVNVFYRNYLINCNVGDSRTLLLQREREQTDIWKPCYSSLDHTPGLMEKAIQINKNGGRFLYEGATYQQAGYIIEESVRMSRSHDEWLANCRIGRQFGWKIQELDFPALTTLNLTGTMGDLFFKYDPPLLTSRPDVEFIQLDLNTKSYMMVMASDGLWDHMSRNQPEVQNEMVAEFVDSIMEYPDEPESIEIRLVNDENEIVSSDTTSQFFRDSKKSESDYSHVKHGSKRQRQCSPSDSEESSSVVDYSQVADVDQMIRKVGVLAHGLADREMVSSQSNLFGPSFARYDDVTVFCVLLDGIFEDEANAEI